MEETFKNEINEESTFKRNPRKVTEDARVSRGALDRASDSRTASERNPIVFGGISRFNLPRSFVQRMKDSGKVVGFVVYSSGNQEQRDNYQNAVDRGWKPIKASEHPELSRQYELSPFSTKEDDQLVKRSGQIAMVRDADVDKAENEYYDHETLRQRKYTESFHMNKNDPLAPKLAQDEKMRFLGR